MLCIFLCLSISFSKAFFFYSAVGSFRTPFPFHFISSVDGGGFEPDQPVDEPKTTPFVKGLVVFVVDIIETVVLGNEMGVCVEITFPSNFASSPSFDDPLPTTFD